jgi:hypothetical protein
MFNPGELIVDLETGARARFVRVHSASWPDILAVAAWPKGTEVLPGHYGVPYARCRLFVGPLQDGAR